MEPKPIELRLCEPRATALVGSIEPTGATNDLVGTAEENGTEVEVSDMRATDDDFRDLVIVLTLIRLLSALTFRCSGDDRTGEELPLSGSGRRRAC